MVVNVVVLQVFFKNLVLCVGMVENCDFFIGEVVVVFLFQNGIGNLFVFFIVGYGFDDFNFLILFFVGLDFFLNLLVVEGDYFIGGLYDVFC